MSVAPCFMFVVLVAIFVVVMVILISVSVKQNTAQCYQKLAEHYGGKLKRGGTFEYPAVHFVHGRSWVAVDVFSTGGNPATYFTRTKVTLPRNVTRCEIYPEGVWSRFGKLMGMDDVEIGAPGFDEEYVIKGSSRRELVELLTPDVRRQIERIRGFQGNDGIYVSFEGQNLLVKVRSYIRDHESLFCYVDLVLGLVDEVVDLDEEGIQFVDDGSPPAAIGSICQICGDEISEQVVFCRRCQTPHHQDCWRYYGACSTYGCGEKKYLRPDSRRERAAKKL